MSRNQTGDGVCTGLKVDPIDDLENEDPEAILEASIVLMS